MKHSLTSENNYLGLHINMQVPCIGNSNKTAFQHQSISIIIIHAVMNTTAIYNYHMQHICPIPMQLFTQKRVQTKKIEYPGNKDS